MLPHAIEKRNTAWHELLSFRGDEALGAAEQEVRCRMGTPIVKLAVVIIPCPGLAVGGTSAYCPGEMPVVCMEGLVASCLGYKSMWKRRDSF